MADYPPISFPDQVTRAIQTATPTRRFRIEYDGAQDVERIVDDPPGARPVADEGRTLVADYEFPTLVMPSIEEVRDMAESSAVIERLIPTYAVDDREFYPQPDILIITAEDDSQAEELRGVIETRVQESLGVGNELVLREQMFPGQYVYDVVPQPAEPGFVLHALQMSDDLGEPGSVAIDAAHPDKVTANAACVAYTNYTGRYNHSGNLPSLKTGVEAVAILDGFFELDHPALNFVRRNNNPPRGISLIDKPQCAVSAHGTSCAGVIGADAGNTQYVGAFDGVVPGVELLPIRVYEPGMLKHQEERLAKGIQVAVDAGVGVVSISLAIDDLLNGLVRAAIDHAEANGVVVVAGAGNGRGSDGNPPPPGADRPIGYPARFRRVLAVGAASLDPFRTPSLRRSVNEFGIGGGALWSSKYGLPDTQGAYRPGVSVVAQGTNVVTTDLLNPFDIVDPADPVNPGGFWTGFRATSAAAPIVAGLAARLQAAGGLSAAAIRARIECLAHQPKDFIAKQSFEIKGYGPRNYSDELGFGWIRRSVDALECEPLDPGDVHMTTPVEPSVGEEPTPGETGPVLDEECTQVECAGLPAKDYTDMVADCAQPLSVFLKALADRRCCQMLYDFLDKAYLTAYNAGVPYAAAVWLGSGDWDSVNRTLMAENDLIEATVKDLYAELGPIWVKAR